MLIRSKIASVLKPSVGSTEVITASTPFAGQLCDLSNLSQLVVQYMTHQMRIGAALGRRWPLPTLQNGWVYVVSGSDQRGRDLVAASVLQKNHRVGILQGEILLHAHPTWPENREFLHLSEKECIAVLPADMKHIAGLSNTAGSGDSHLNNCDLRVNLLSRRKDAITGKDIIFATLVTSRVVPVGTALFAPYGRQFVLALSKSSTE